MHLWKVDSNFLHLPNGQRISTSILEDFEYWNQLQQQIGFHYDGCPAKARPGAGSDWRYAERLLEAILERYNEISELVLSVVAIERHGDIGRSLVAIKQLPLRGLLLDSERYPPMV